MASSLAKLENPWTVKGRRVRISVPEYPWEKMGDRKLDRNPEQNPALDGDEPVHIDVNEGPEFLQHGDKIFLIYSASACWTDFYELGMLTARASDNLMDPASWKKSPVAVFWQSPQAHVYGPGHNSFFKSLDGKQDWILYHANSESNQDAERIVRRERSHLHGDPTALLILADLFRPGSRSPIPVAPNSQEDFIAARIGRPARLRATRAEGSSAPISSTTY